MIDGPRRRASSSATPPPAARRRRSPRVERTARRRTAGAGAGTGRRAELRQAAAGRITAPAEKLKTPADPPAAKAQQTPEPAEPVEAADQAEPVQSPCGIRSRPPVGYRTAGAWIVQVTALQDRAPPRRSRDAAVAAGISGVRARAPAPGAPRDLPRAGRRLPRRDRTPSRRHAGSRKTSSSNRSSAHANLSWISPSRCFPARCSRSAFRNSAIPPSPGLRSRRCWWRSRTARSRRAAPSCSG